jgi:hypothetical protein
LTRPAAVTIRRRNVQKKKKKKEIVKLTSQNPITTSDLTPDNDAELKHNHDKKKIHEHDLKFLTLLSGLGCLLGEDV